MSETAKRNYQETYISRGAIQGDIPSSIYFLVSLDKLLKDFGALDTGIKLTDELKITDLEFADDAILPNEDTEAATDRVTLLNEKADEEAAMSISVPKTKAQHIRKQVRFATTTESDILNLPPEKQFKFHCEKCGTSYPK